MSQRSNEVLGINTRNAIYVRPYNSSRAKEIADNKLLCKKILNRQGIPTAEIYKVIRNHKQLETLRWEDLPKSFALKPNIGTGGSGIQVFYGKKKNHLEWIKPNGSTWTTKQLKNHISSILDGQFSMGNRKDIAIIEERIVNHPVLKPYSYKGIPDIRIIVFNKVPIMAELRLPTFESSGKANLHAGGIGVGIDIASGITTVAIHRKGSSLVSDLYDIIETTLDDKHLPLSGIQIPNWKELLKIAIRCQEVSGLGYLGADIAIDQNKGPVVFELNARAGLAIQIANLSGLRNRLERVEGLKVKNAEHGIQIARDLFGGEVEFEIEAISGRQIIGLVEKANFFACPTITEESTSNNKSESTEKNKKSKKKVRSKYKNISSKVQVDTGNRKSIIAKTLATRLGYNQAIIYFNELDIPKSFEDRDQAKTYLNEIKDKIIKDCPQIIDLTIINENDKIKILPVIEVKLTISGQTVISKMAITGRKNMTYNAVLGKYDLRSFLIDASKTFSLH